MVFCCLVIKNPSLLKTQRQFDRAGDTPWGMGTQAESARHLAGDTTAHTNVPRHVTRNYLDTGTATGRALAQGMAAAMPKGSPPLAPGR